MIDHYTTIHNILRNEFTPLHLAAFTGDVDKASIILEQIGRQEVDCPGFGEVTALHVAVMKVRITVKPESKSPIPCPNRPQILTLRSDQV